ncbi:ankyrin repeat domain-containing protein [Methanolapillus ohkumae]|uniref:Ankyrin repeat domain-containing protein n=1 Tax=Methanolapillus ohkumae TaxID=3028298 RepID=A0AA96V6H5_9EURY|nr:hypothetical protein MsAm2_08130 [Methanosarcinaceae archaeon Am2]
MNFRALAGAYQNNASHDEIMQFYTKYMAENPIDDDSGNTLLHAAAYHADMQAVTLLLDAGYDPAVKNNKEENALTQLAAIRPSYFYQPNPGDIYQTAGCLLAKNPHLCRGNKCYLIAAKDGNGEFVKALFDNGVKITGTDDSGNNGLHLLFSCLYNPMNDLRLAQKRLEDAQSSNNQAAADVAQKNVADYQKKLDTVMDNVFMVAKAFLGAGVDPEDKNEMLETAHVLAQRQGATLIGALLKGEISGDEPADDPNAKLRAATGGRTLHKAIGDVEALKAIVALGADVNGVDDIYGYGEGTPLAAACFDFDELSIQTLLELGADPNFKAGDGRSALAWLFVRNIPMSKDKVNTAKIIGSMVEKGLDINGNVNDRSDTLLLLACASENGDHPADCTVEKSVTFRLSVILEALKKGADVNQQNLAGQTPLMISCLGERHFKEAPKAQLLFLEKNAALDLRDKNGNTALIYAAQNTNQALSKELAEMLFEFGDPVPDAVNNAGKTALDYATEKNNEMLVKFLLSNM